MFANVHAKNYKLLYVVTDKRTKLNIDFVHDVGLLKFDKTQRCLKFCFRPAIEVRYDQYR